MTTKEILHKYILIIERIKKGDYPSLEQIKEYVTERLSEYYKPSDFSERTFLRDKNDIADLYNIDITYYRTQKGYGITYNCDDSTSQRSLEALNVFLTLSEAGKKDFNEIIIPDNKCELGSEHLAPLLKSIQNQLVTQFAYNKYSESGISFRKVAPYAIKESQGRWYLIGKDLDDNAIKVFGVDRINSLTITQQTFKMDPNYNTNEFFRYRFGVNAYCEYGEPEMVTLQFPAPEKQYIITKPLHSSQQVVEQTESSITVSVTVFPSIDFVMELLRYGSNVKVLSPQWLVSDIKKSLSKALDQYR